MWRGYPTKLWLATALLLYASAWNVVDSWWFWNMYGLYQSYSDIIVLLVLNWEHVWRLHIGFKEEMGDSITGRLFALSSFCSFSLPCFAFDLAHPKNCTVVSWLCVVCVVCYNKTIVLVCKFAKIKYKKVYSCICMKFFFKKCCVCTSVYWCTSICYICGDNMIESDELWAQFEVFTSGGLLADWK